SDCARISVDGIDLRGRGSKRDVGRIGRIDGNGQDPLPLLVRNAVDEPPRDLNLVSGGRRNGERILCTVENSLNAVNENVAGHDAKVAIGGTGRRGYLNQIELVVWSHVAVGDDVFGDAAQHVQENGRLLVAVGIETYAALLLKDAAVMPMGIKSVPGEIALKLPGHDSLLGCMKNARVHRCGHEFLEPNLQIGFALRLKEIVKDAHFGL